MSARRWKKIRDGWMCMSDLESVVQRACGLITSTGPSRARATNGRYGFAMDATWMWPLTPAVVADAVAAPNYARVVCQGRARNADCIDMITVKGSRHTPSRMRHGSTTWQRPPGAAKPRRHGKLVPPMPARPQAPRSREKLRGTSMRVKDVGCACVTRLTDRHGGSAGATTSIAVAARFTDASRAQSSPFGLMKEMRSGTP